MKLFCQIIYQNNFSSIDRDARRAREKKPNKKYLHLNEKKLKQMQICASFLQHCGPALSKKKKQFILASPHQHSPCLIITFSSN